MTINERKFIESRIFKYKVYADEERAAWISSSCEDRESFIQYQMNQAVVDAMSLLLVDLGLFVDVVEG